MTDRKKYMDGSDTSVPSKYLAVQTERASDEVERQESAEYISEYEVPRDIVWLKAGAYALVLVVAIIEFLILNQYAGLGAAVILTIYLVGAMMVIGWAIRKHTEYKIACYYENSIRDTDQDYVMGEVRDGEP